MGRLLAVKNCFSGSSNFVIAAILISGFGFRVVGLNVGLPDTPDPREIIIAQDVLNLIHFTAPPQTYNWPGTAWFYIIAAVGKLLSIGGLYLTEARVILLARCINTLLSTATLWFTYSIGQHAYNRRVGQIAAGLLAVSMLHATNESRFALVDIPATFCVTLFPLARRACALFFSGHLHFRRQCGSVLLPESVSQSNLRPSSSVFRCLSASGVSIFIGDLQ